MSIVCSLFSNDKNSKRMQPFYFLSNFLTFRINSVLHSLDFVECCFVFENNTERVCIEQGRLRVSTRAGIFCRTSMVCCCRDFMCSLEGLLISLAISFPSTRLSRDQHSVHGNFTAFYSSSFAYVVVFLFSRLIKNSFLHFFSSQLSFYIFCPINILFIRFLLISFIFTMAIHNLNSIHIENHVHIICYELLSLASPPLFPILLITLFILKSGGRHPL